MTRPGRIEQASENCRDFFRLERLDGWFQDVRFGLRTLRRRPAFTAIAMAMLALGMGINIAVFTVVNAAVFKGWPLVSRNDRIVQIATSRNFVYYPDFEAWRSQAKSFRGMALLRGRFHTLDDAANAPETCFTTEVTAGIFPLLGVKPILGRDFLPSDEQPGAAPVVILRYEVWARRFGADPAIAGKTIRIDGRPTTVIGVMPKGFSFPYPMRQDLWTPLRPTVAALTRETGYAPYAFARLADGATVESARAEMAIIGQRLTSTFPRTNRDVVPEVRSFEEWFIGPDARTLYKGMWAAVGFLLLIVCANVANLLVQQAMGRAQEISIRLALGAGRWRIHPSIPHRKPAAFDPERRCRLVDRQSRRAHLRLGAGPRRCPEFCDGFPRIRLARRPLCKHRARRWSCRRRLSDRAKHSWGCERFEPWDRGRAAREALFRFLRSRGSGAGRGAARQRRGPEPQFSKGLHGGPGRRYGERSGDLLARSAARTIPQPGDLDFLLS